MNTKTVKLSLLAAVAALAVSGQAKAGHIDELGLGASLVSSDGAGNFVVNFTEFMGSNGWMWQNSAAGLWDNTYSIGFSVTSFTGAGTLSPMFGSGTGTFMGLVDSTGTPTAGFGPSQIGTQFVNGLSDAAVYSYNQAFSITGFDPAATYSVAVSMTDCCFVTQGGTPQFSGNLVIDPTQVVHDHTHGVPDYGSTAALLGLALTGLGVLKKKKTA